MKKKPIPQHVLNANFQRQLNEWAKKEYGIEQWIVNLLEPDDYRYAVNLLDEQLVKHCASIYAQDDLYYVTTNGGLRHVDVRELYFSIRTLGVL